jgi:ubiquinone biosynthesis protein COQ9
LDRVDAGISPALLEAAVAQVTAMGWRPEALQAAAAEVGMAWPVAQAWLPKGLTSLLEALAQTWSQEFAAQIPSMDLESMRTTARVRALVLAKLAVLEPYHPIFGGLQRATLRHPSLGITVQRGIWQTADQIWRAAGDRATDHNWYSKRLLLSGVYASTLWFWAKQPLTDAARTATADFLDRRLHNVHQLAAVKTTKWRPQQLFHLFKTPEAS